MNYMQIQQVPYSIVQEKTLFVGVRAKILLFWGFVQKYYCPEILSLRSLVQGPFQGLCRNISFGEKYSPLYQHNLHNINTICIKITQQHCNKQHFLHKTALFKDERRTVCQALLVSWAGTFIFKTGCTTDSAGHFSPCYC